MSLQRTLCSLCLLGSLAACGLSQAQAPEASATDAVNGTPRRVDDRRPGQPYRLWLGATPVDLTGSWEYSDEARRNFDLDARRSRDRRVREHEVKFEARAGLAPDLTAFVQAVALHETRTTQGTAGRQRTHEWQRGEMWLQWDRIGGTPWSLQVGRVPLLERRSLWWDDDLDALRVRYAAGAWRLDTGLGRAVARVSSAESGIPPEQRGVWRQWGQGGWTWAQRQQIEAFWLIVVDRSGTPPVGSSVAANADPDSSDPRGLWWGLRASGEWRGLAANPATRLSYWADAVQLRGRETLTAFSNNTAGASNTRRLRSWALDTGATLTWGAAWRPSLTLAYARGSGGEDSATRDANFRQTGLHENKARLAGVKRLRRYGELLQPDLSNLAITTLGSGIRFLGNSSAELVLHQYRQVVPASTGSAARLSADPLGQQRRLGRELDLVIALREWSWLELTLRWSRFEPGPAYAADRRDAANALELGAALNF
ncbi:MAG: hypothetical protein KA141_00955 [Rubrivivax sp.]|nr:hypothetical protein [Rubrivivax sp.]